MIRKTLVASGAALLVSMMAAAMAADPKDDPYIWLEEIQGEDALDWVREQNAKGEAALKADPRFDGMLADAKAILTSKARIPYGQTHNGYIYNFWQDAINKRGLWRRARSETYRKGDPVWETVIDYDALAKREDRNWVRGSVVCLNPDYVHCMVELSDGGKDAGYWREFNTQTKEFVDGGFYLPEAKSDVSWVDENTLLVGTDRGPSTLTESGYPRTSVKWTRGTDLGDAPVIFEGPAQDVWDLTYAEHDGDATYIIGLRGTSFFEREYSLQNSDGTFTPLPFPPNTDLQGVLNGELIALLREDWTHQDESFSNGSVIAYDLEAGTTHLVMAPAENQSIERVALGKSNIIIQYLEDVSGKAVRLTRGRAGDWKQKPFKLPENGVVRVISAGGGTDEAYFSFESMTTPNSLYHASARNRLTRVQSLPALYDAEDVVVEQRFAVSADGTKVPYFIMAKADVLKAGNAPTVQYGYGGFLASILPVYYSDPGRPQHGALAGRMWVSRGGVLVLSNIRGGSEYGPKWHQAALKENRQKAFDDFIAISEALIDTGVTSPEKLGAVGRSNGGLLMGAIMTQRPDLYAAVDIGVPLFDMYRYDKLLAGASWVGEYGDPDIADEWAFISQYSPYQKLEAGKAYPAPFFYTSTKDDRVHPGHARKAAAKMADLGYDVFYYENIEGGHGGTANQDQLAYRTALEFAYFAKMLMGDENKPGGGSD